MEQELESSSVEEPQAQQNKSRLVLWVISLLGFLVVILASCWVFVWYLNQPIETTTTPVSFTIENGENVRSIASRMETEGIIRSETFLYFLIVTFFDPTSIKASTHIIEDPLTSFEIAKRLVVGDFDNDLVRFTHIEGEPVSKIAKTAEEMLVDFDTSNFISEALPLEGKLFPDTYFIPETFSAEELVELLHSSFVIAIEPYDSEITSSELSLEQILILASIIEREANTLESMKLVASVFLNRIAIGMPLQADASIEYVLDKPLSELTAVDLTIDSPYNTYVNPGLPPTPIGNPGITAIEAILDPATSDYFYYITDDTGTFHFAETYNQHLTNVNRYLR